MKIYDITLPISPTSPVWPGDPPVDILQAVQPGPENPFTVSRVCMSAHTGTHVDAPRHIFTTGKPVDALDIDVLTGPAYVIDARGVAQLTAEALSQLSIPSRATRLLFLTDNTAIWESHPTEFVPNYVALTADGAQWLVERQIRLVGIDYLSIAPYGEEIRTHEILLQAGVIVVEGLYLNHVPPGAYELYCLPLKIVGADGAPARVVLVSR